MGKRRRRLNGKLAVALFVVPAAGCSQVADPVDPAALAAGEATGTISIWAHQGQEVEVEALQASVAAFNESQDEIRADLTFIPEADYPRTLQTTKPEDLPDVLEFDGPLMASLIYSRKLAPLEGLVGQETIDNQTVSVQAQNTYIGDDQLYALSMFDSGLGMYGNRSLLEEAGVRIPTGIDDAWSAEEFDEVLAQLAETDPDGKPLDLKENYGAPYSSYAFLPIVNSTGTEVVVDNRAEGHLNSAPVVDALRQFASWRRYVDPDTDDAAFVQGRVALSWVGHWVYGVYAEALGDDLLVLPLPDFGVGAKSGQGSLAWGIGAQTGKAPAAAKFLESLMADESVARMTEGNGAPPGTETVTAASDLYGEGGPLELYAEALARTCGTGPPTEECVAIPRPGSPAWPTISTQFAKAWFAAYNGADPQSELDRAARIIDLDYQDNDDYDL
jgi:multiple sugar transport system substrate-binding protein